MSAGDRETEAQAKKGEETGSSDRDSRAATALKQHWDVGLRSIELLLSVLAVGLVAGALYAPQVVQADHRHIALIYSAYSSFIIITGVLVIGRILGETIGWKTSISFSVLGVIMFTAAAAVIFYDIDDMNEWQPHFYGDWHRSYYTNLRPNKQSYDLLLSSGVFAVINAFVFIVHIIFTFRKDAEY